MPGEKPSRKLWERFGVWLVMSWESLGRI